MPRKYIKSKYGKWGVPLDDSKIVELYVNQELSTTKTAKILGCHCRAVYNHLKKLGLMRNKSESMIALGRTVIIPKNELYKRFLVNNKSAAKTAKEYKCSGVTILKLLRRYGFGGEITLGYKKGIPNPKIAGENSPTKRPEVREKLRENHADKTGRKNGMFGKPAAHGKKISYKGVWMRSSWEVEYAKYLDRNKIKWQYEPKAFDLGEATYRPDFYLPKLNKYIEIKGFWRDRAKEKFDLFQKLYSNINIEILSKLELTKLGVL